MKAPQKSNTSEAARSTSPFFGKDNSGSFFSKADNGSGSFFSTSGIQASLTVGQPDDPYEKEADHVSRQVVDSIDQATGIQQKLSAFGLQQMLVQPSHIGSRISRKLQKTIFRTLLAVQAKCSECEEEEKMQHKSGSLQFAGDGAAVSPDIEAQIKGAQGGGQPMDEVTQAGMESSFGADFSGVRVHTDSRAVQMSSELNAHAFTVGSDIFFNEGRYQPHSKQGAGLLAHELTHTVQQGAAVQNKRISRLPYAQLFSNPAVAHLSSINGGSLQQASLYRREIARFQKEVPDEEMMMQQQQLLQTKEVDKVQMKDNAKSLRKYEGNGGGGGASPAKKTPKLKKTPLSSPVAADCGGFSWPVRWSIENADSSVNGWVVQKVELITNVKDCAETNIDLETRNGLKPSWYPMWEAWKVSSGNVMVGDSSQPHNADTYGSNPIGNNTKGNITVRGTAEYYDGLTLPSTFRATNGPPAWALPTTKTAPTLPGGTGSLDHSLTATWDCCGTDKTTAITTT